MGNAAQIQMANEVMDYMDDCLAHETGCEHGHTNRETSHPNCCTEKAILQKIQKKALFNYFLRVYNSDFMHELGENKYLYQKWISVYKPHLNNINYK